jgi:diadenylate cyclase
MVDFIDIVRDIHIADIIDWSIVSTLIYQIVLLVKGTRSLRIITGLAILFSPLFISPWIKLNTIYFILMKILPMGFIALVVIFQPELRRALETIGRGSSITRKFFGFEDEALHKIVNELKKASQAISRRKAGALIVLERETGLQEFIETGLKLNSEVLSELIVSIFIPTTPLHDGAVIIREDKIVSAACFLPLSESTTIAKELGTRHRAAIGISEVSDALVIVISEETGAISIVFNGRMTRNIDYETLGRLLLKMYKLNYNISNFIRNRT